MLQFELPTGDPQHPDYSPTLTGVILFNHASCAYWPEGDEYSDDVPPLCSSVDGKQGYGEPGGVCEACALSQFGSASNGRGKACKNMRVLYLLRSGEVGIDMLIPFTGGFENGKFLSLGILFVPALFFYHSWYR